VANSPVVDRFISAEWEERVGGKLEFIADPEEAIAKALEHIDKKRKALGLVEYDPNRFGQSGDWQMEVVMSLPPEEVNLYSYAEMAAKAGKG